MTGLYDITQAQSDAGLSMYERSKEQDAQRSVQNSEIQQENLGAAIGAGIEATQIGQNYQMMKSLTQKPAATGVGSPAPATAPAAPAPQTPSVVPHTGPVSTGPLAVYDPSTQGTVYNAIMNHAWPRSPGMTDQMAP